MKGTRRATAEDEANGAPNGGSPRDTTRMLMEMMKAMRRQNDERAEEFRRAHEEMRLRMEETLRG